VNTVRNFVFQEGGYFHVDVTPCSLNGKNTLKPKVHVDLQGLCGAALR
jgi:hypothetical protein